MEIACSESSPQTAAWKQALRIDRLAVADPAFHAWLKTYSADFSFFYRREGAQISAANQLAQWPYVCAHRLQSRNAIFLLGACSAHVPHSASPWRFQWLCLSSGAQGTFLWSLSESKRCLLSRCFTVWTVAACFSSHCRRLYKFQRDGTPPRHTHETIELLQQEIPDIIRPYVASQQSRPWFCG